MGRIDYTNHVARQPDPWIVSSDCVDMEPHQRLRLARERAGYATAADLARKKGWHYSTYAAHENGQNGISVRSAEKYARALRVSASWILTGEGWSSTNTVPIRGFVGAGNELMLIEEDDNEIGRAEIPPGGSSRLTAIIVRGQSMVPAYYHGDTIYYDPEKDVRSPNDLLEKECVIKLTNGRLFIKRILPGRHADRYTLISYNAEPILDCEIEWACPVRFIARA